MINILIPLAKHSKFFEDQYFPKPLFEINNRLMIEYAVSSLNRIKGEKRYIFILKEEECVKFHLDKTVRHIAGGKTVVIRQQGETKGAACSCLLAIDHINNNDRLVISNGDQYLDVDYNKILKNFDQEGVQGGVVTFDAVHPQWSYAKLDAENGIIETAEKNPISRHAIAGFYYFQKGADFVRAAQQSIMKGADVHGMFYTAPTFNELVLEGKTLKAHRVDNDRYHSFYSFAKIREFEKMNIRL